ncbi:MAG TPA: alpha/beta fold hydrolase [Terriglobales bacterium]|nr:alpha/beta fold hydrolase [Terriglobales bacterium]
MRLVALAILFVMPLLAQSSGAKTAPPPPASMQQMILPSHGSMLLGVFYLAAGNEPHPTAILLHGFPGFEQNLDLAQTMREQGWNVLAMHYRGSWGVKGDFSFLHSAEDADTQVRFVLDPVNVAKYRIDPHRVIVIGHSMGGYMAASAIAHNPEVAAAVLISAWNIGTDYEYRLRSKSTTIETEAAELSRNNNLLPLSGTTGQALATEIYEHKSELNFNNLAPRISPRPVFVITANDGLLPVDHALTEALQKAGDSHVRERHWDTDHSYSAQRAELAEAILTWTKENLPK